MRDDATRTVEKIIDALAATAFGTACGFAGTVFAGVAAGAAAGLALALATWRLLTRIEPLPAALALAEFVPAGIDIADDADELLLTEKVASAPTDELLLDDILEELGPDARVVRLFAKPIPTPGELSSTIDRHLGAAPRSDAPDASDALFNALADLRRSLR